MKVKKQKKYKIPPLPLPAARIAGLASCKPLSVGRPGDVRYTTPLPHQPHASSILTARIRHFSYLVIQNAPSRDSDQTARMHRLIGIYTGRTCSKARFLRFKFIC